MSLSREQFVERWKQLPESQEGPAVDAAWRRYQQVSDTAYVTDYQDQSASEFQTGFRNLLEDASVKSSIAQHTFITLKANTIPWTASELWLKSGQVVSTFAAGRVWRSRILDMWLQPQFALWFRVGVNGLVFNSTADTNTFQAKSEGELYVSNQFPGQFGEPTGGRLATPLKVYEKAEGQFEVLIVVWKEGVNAQGVLQDFQTSSPSPRTDLVSKELERIRRDAHPSVPDDWKLLWFLGNSSIYSLQTSDKEPCMHCKPYLNTGILQKDLTPPMMFKVGTRVRWFWLISSLPSRLREDLTFTHDYLSVAFEFENGCDLTYTWSWELPCEFGYWCPLPAWADREYHVVIRSGTKRLSEWIREERDLYADYVNYVEKGVEDGERLPKQVVRVWFIAGNRWQRYEGEMSVKRLQIRHDSEVIDLL